MCKALHDHRAKADRMDRLPRLRQMASPMEREVRLATGLLAVRCGTRREGAFEEA
jgi:hypothetical protein